MNEHMKDIIVQPVQVCMGPISTPPIPYQQYQSGNEHGYSSNTGLAMNMATGTDAAGYHMSSLDYDSNTAISPVQVAGAAARSCGLQLKAKATLEDYAASQTSHIAVSAFTPTVPSP